MDFELAPAVSAALRAAIDDSATCYGSAVRTSATPLFGFAARKWAWEIDPTAVTAVVDVGVGVVEVLRPVQVSTQTGEGHLLAARLHPSHRNRGRKHI